MKNLVSKKKVVIRPIDMAEDFIRVRVDKVVYQDIRFIGSVTYFTRDEEGIEKIIYQTTSQFNETEAGYLEQALGVTGNTFVERYKDLIVKVLHYQVGVIGAFGLTSADFDEEESVSYE